MPSTSATAATRSPKTTACDLAASGDIAALSALSHAELHAADKIGGQAIHWAAGSAQLDTLKWLLLHGGFTDPESEGNPPSRRAAAQAPRRRPLHYAARNGALAVVQYLLEELRVEAEPRARHGVTPLQLAVWQNQLDIVRYLVEAHAADPKQVNDFACGTQHWIGTSPASRAGCDGAELLPLARYLRSCGVCFHAVQRQGHTPLHKAAWGGHIALCRWLRDECGAVDDVQDLGGNYAADEADMGGHVELAAWLRDECSGARARSCTILGLAPNTTDLAVIRGAYLELSRKLHPDRVAATGPPARAREVRPSDGAGAVAGEAREKQNGSAAGGSRETKKEFTAVEGGPQCTDFIFVAACEKEGNCGANCGAWRADETRKDFRAGDTGVHSYDFTAVAAAYDHLTRLGGRGSQANPTHSLRRMLQATGGSDGEMEMGARTGEKGLGACAEKSRPDGVSVAVEPDEETEMGARTGEKAAGPSPMAGGLVPGTCAGEGRADAVGAGESSGQDGGGTSACPNWESADNSLQSRQRQDACVSRDALSQRAKGRSGDDAFQQKVKGGCADSIQQRAKGGSGDAFSLGEKDRSGDAFFQQKESLDACVKEARSIFKAKLAAVAHEYSCSGGLPLSKLRGKYEQVWRGEQLPSPAELGLAPRTKLVDMLRSFSDTVIVEKAVIAGGQPLIHPIVSREEALGIGVRLAGRDEGSGEKDADRNTVTVEEGVVVGGQPLVRPIVSREEALGIEVGVAPTMDVRQGEESGAKDGAGLAERGAAERGAAGRTEESGGAQVHSPSLIVGRDASPVMSTGGGIGGFTAAHPQMPDLPSMPNEDHLPVVIIGGGIGGLAAAVALQSRGVPCVVYERDSGWDHKRRGYGLTLSNARALAALGIEAEVRETNAYCPSDAHWVFDQAGKVLGYFGVGLNGTRHELRGNLRVPRQVLRRLLVARLRPGTVRWGWKMLRYTEKVGAVTATLERVAMPGRAGRTGGGVIPEGAETPDGAAMHGEKIPEGAKVPAGAEMWGGGAIRGKAAMPRGAEVAAPAFAIEAAVPLGGVVDVRGCLLLGADGVRSAVRSQKHRDTPRYVGVVLFLGESRIQHPLLHEQGFYTVDGLHRIFTMPLEPLAGRGAGAGEGAAAMKVGEGADLSTPAHSTMWQLSLALPSEEAATLKKGEGAAGPAAVAAGAGTARPAALKAGATPAHSTMWQLSFALPSEEAAVALCSGGGKALLREALRRCSAWHSPVPEMLAATDPATVWGTPLVDCAPLPRRSRDREIGPAAWTSRVVLMGDAAHPMTPFKGQGANMTLADAPLLAQCVADSLGAGVPPGRRSDGPRLFAALARFEREMMDRAQLKVEASRAAADAYHSPAALLPANYGLSGVPTQLVADLISEMRTKNVNAACGAEIEARALDAWRCVQMRAENGTALNNTASNSTVINSTAVDSTAVNSTALNSMAMNGKALGYEAQEGADGDAMLPLVGAPNTAGAGVAKADDQAGAEVEAECAGREAGSPSDGGGRVDLRMCCSGGAIGVSPAVPTVMS